ncbi:MAG: zinc-dependent metalloprotease, partial [Coprobacter sp.]|nr:zinc-dependent metalloprotease [Coprobacter sp.]
SVEENYISPLMTSFKIEACNKDTTSFVIKINDMYDGNSPLNEFFSNLNMSAPIDKDLSRIVKVKAFENNVVVVTELTSHTKEFNRRSNITAEMSSSIVLLPEVPMLGRYDNPAVGYFNVPQLYFSDKQQKLEARKLITRWRLEPKPEDKEAYLRGELVEPQKPIVFYIDRTTPVQWRKYIRQGVEDWQAAFEKAGFKNAIIAKQLPDSISADEDDINYSVINYIASDEANAMGPSIYDPRSGEIIEADVIWWHNVISILRNWIMIQTGAVNPAARQSSLPDSLMGDAMRFVACHEIGHSLGLRHNMIASAAYPTDSLRSKTFTDKMKSTASSIMDYARYNYIAQPEDHIDIHNLSPHIGPYDLFAIEFGYRWRDIQSPDDEKEEVYEFISRHNSPLYRFADAQSPREATDPRAMIEDLGDDNVKAARYGMANIKRIMPHLIEWTTTGEKGQTYQEAGRLYNAVIGQWNLYAYHVLSNVGGMYLENTTIGDGKETYAFVEKERQKEAVQFLLDEVLNSPEWLLNAEINKYTFPLQSSRAGVIENSPSYVLKNMHGYIFWDLLTNNRLIRMIENEKINGKKAFTAIEMLDMMHNHIFGVTEKGNTPDANMRALQKGFLDALLVAAQEEATTKSAPKTTSVELLEGVLPCYREIFNEVQVQAVRNVNYYSGQSNRTSDAISLKRGELLRIKELLQKRINTTTDLSARYHYNDMLLRINTGLGLVK